MKSFRIVLCTLGVLIVIGAGFALSGAYNMSARVPHLAPTFLLLETVRDRSIEHHSKSVELPDLETADLARIGAVHFDETCSKCHGAPGVEQEEFAEGLYPEPPSLKTATNELSPAEIFWTIENGLKMTGMPSFGINHEKEEIAGMTAFIKTLPELDADGYGQFVMEAKAGYTGEHHHDHEESSPTDTQTQMEEEQDHADSSQTENHEHGDEGEDHHH